MRLGRTAAAGAAVVGAALIGLHLPGVHGTGVPRRPAPAAATDAAPVFRAAPGAPRALPASAATRLDVGALDIHARLVPLAASASGRLAVPPMSRPSVAGWYRGGASPGASGRLGPAVVVGHVDTRTGPAVFWPLAAAKPGMRVSVRRADGRTAVFTVHAVRVYRTDRFPDRTVYGPTDTPELRLITCGGTFDRTAGAYTSNVVVFAHLTAVTP